MVLVAAAQRPSAVWTRPTPDRDTDWVKPSYIPTPVAPDFPSRTDRPIYAPVTPEFRPAELPETPKEMPTGPKMPERRPDDIPAVGLQHTQGVAAWEKHLLLTRGARGPRSRS